MLFQLGSRASNGDVVDLLIACHHRIREHLVLGRRIAHAPPHTTPESLRGAAGRVRDYFGRAFPLHRADEEDDIFPLLLGRSDQLDIAIGELMKDHGRHESLVATIVEICTEIERDPAQTAVHAERLSACVQELEKELVTHLSLEERTVFPAITTMKWEERQGILDRMRKRREIDLSR